MAERQEDKESKARIVPVVPDHFAFRVPFSLSALLRWTLSFALFTCQPLGQVRRAAETEPKPGPQLP